VNDLYFHWTFIFVFVGFTAIRAYYHRLAEKTRGRVEYREGRTLKLLRLGFGLPFILALLGYMIQPGILGWARFPLPAWAQWVGVGLGLASLPLIWWVQAALGSNFSTPLHVRDEHTLVTRGPYRWVRHPMYTVLYIHFTGVLLLTRNWLIGCVFLLALTLIVAGRIRSEEALMVEKFGESYQRYMGRTGRFLPRLSWPL
jgi:protein-S-isoprenylcysteine O-methyltransferase Ste14